ncbi:aspartate/glutamate racemase family protein [Nocardiopsis composta]
MHDAATFASAAVKVAELAARMEREDGVDALLISCAADPGLAGARAAVGVPVVGAGSAAARRALELGSRIGVLDLTVRTPESVTSVLGPRQVAALVPEGWPGPGTCAPAPGPRPRSGPPSGWWRWARTRSCSPAPA